MAPRTALVVGAVQAFAFGLPLLLLPGAILLFSGLAPQDQAVAIARGAGATVVGLGVIDWTLRKATGDTLRALLAGNLVVQVLSLAVNAGEVFAGHLPIQAASAAVLHLVLSVMFVLALREARSTNAARAGAPSGPAGP